MNDFINENVAKYEHLTKQCNNTLNNQRYELHLIEVKVIIKMPVLLILAHTFTFFDIDVFQRETKRKPVIRQKLRK